MSREVAGSEVAESADAEDALPSHLQELLEQGHELVDEEEALKLAKEMGRRYWRVFDMLAKESREEPDS